jgi:competence protein ComEC
MQNTYQYWRAAHPLVFITFHLLLGIALTSIVQKPYFFASPFSSILTISLELLLLLLCNITKTPPFVKGVFVFMCLLSWGIILKWNAIDKSKFELPTGLNTQIVIFRNWIIYKLNRNIPSKQANGFAQALLIGVKMDMNKALVNAYTQLGIIHIIAISGMHIDILFKSMSKLLGLLPQKKLFKVFEIVSLLLLVWIYTFIANAGPSIIRASVFFSLYLIGKYFMLSRFTLNSIAAGIFLLIITNAGGIENIGLQLSYAAVIGIHLFYKIIYKSIPIDNPLILFLWSNCCISLAAQITTFPILILHFHQVAAWVLVSNFIMVPLSNIILYGLIILLLLPSQLAMYWGSLIGRYILFFNHLIQNWFIQTKAATVHISMGPLQVFMYYLVLLYAYLWIYQKKSSYLIIILGMLACYSIIKLFS